MQDVDSDARLRRLCDAIDTDTILVLEDVDCVTSTTELTTKEQQTTFENLTGRKVAAGFSFSCLLNIIDGAFHKQGRVIIMTTNFPEKLDPALLRPGRCDMEIQLGLASQYQIRRLFENFFETTISKEQEEQLPHAVISPAKVVSLFILHRSSPQNAIQAVIEEARNPSKTITRVENKYKKL